MFFHPYPEGILAEIQLRHLVEIFTIPETSGCVLYGPESFAEVLGRYGPGETKGLSITRVRRNAWEVRRPDEGLREVLDPTPFVESWLIDSCADDQGEAGALIDNLECELDHSEEPEDARRREALRYLVARAREAGVLERPAS